MECKKLSTKETSVLYQNRFCDQENFDIIVTRVHRGETDSKSIYRLKYPSFTNIETLVPKTKYIQGTVTSGSSIWILCTHGTKIKSSDDNKLSSRSNELSNNLVQLPDAREKYSFCSFTKYKIQL